MTSELTTQELDEIDARHKAATPGPWGVYEFGGGTAIDIAADLTDTGTGYRARREICRLEDEPLDNDPAHREWTAEEDWAQVQADAAFVAHAREDVRLLLAEVRRLRFRLAELGDQGPDDRETVEEAAQMYRSLRAVIERTMTDPDRWDGDEDESFHLGRYVEWLAAGQPDDDEPDTRTATAGSV
ncbi:hypothetical protein [Streptomyces caniscabiei]|uniref:hypothetical protein n=1 Tax=Streptomyces caniscabiei TaxID=2746961 RepID=UPI0029A652AA|nr:hypothetical protein [Streptomyces caniscabiei]MDX2986534.1 hypothetical protein [Streptomyces caniscabiei]